VPALFLLIGAGIVTLAHTAPFPFQLEALMPGRSMWHGPRHPGQRTIYLTYDDGPNPAATPGLLDVLGRERARATFFVIPMHVTPDTAPILRRAAADGHGIGLHSHTRALIFDSPDRLVRRLAAHADQIAALSGTRPCALFRPHAGWRSGQMYTGLKKAGLTLAGWSFGLWDFNWWRAPKPAELAARLARKASDGDIIVMHDGHHENPRADRQRTIDATAALIPLLRAHGFTFASLCDR
jgi:peptidoglycan/xylan/chitin deacetylase (PgdA/CDA1 family)